MNGIIKQFKDIEGNFNKLDFGDASKAGDIKYYKNIIGFDFTNKDSIPFTIANPSYVDVETTPNIPQTIINPDYPPYEGGSVKHFQSIQGISDLYHQGNIENFDEIHTQSAVFSRGESFIYSSLLEIGERSDPTQANQQLNANSRTILFYPCDWKEEYGGATEFQESGEKVEYKKNRLLMFDGTKPHRSAVHQNPKNRYTIAYKTNIGHK